MIKSNGPTRFTVSLLNNDGKVLSKYERAWPFLDGLNSETYWPGEDVTMNILPVDNVSFVKLELYCAFRSGVQIKNTKESTNLKPERTTESIPCILSGIPLFTPPPDN